jgi:hypothetical protein
LEQRPLAISERPHERFRDLASWSHGSETSYGLIRADILRKTELQPNYSGSDRPFLSELSLYGKFYQISEPLFYKRLHANASLGLADLYLRMPWHKPELTEALKNPSLFQEIDQFLLFYRLYFAHCCRIISRAPINFQERVYCFLHVIITILINFLDGAIWKIRCRLYLNSRGLSILKTFCSKLIKNYS